MRITRADGEVFDLDDHQEIALDHLYENPRAALFLEMSLSKTIATLLYLYDMTYNECAISKTLVIAPEKVARLTWPDEINGWQEVSDFRYSVITGTPKQKLKALNTDADIYFIGVDSLGWLIDQYIYQPTSKSGATKYPWQGSLPFDCIVIDEISDFKNWESKRFKKLRRAINMSKVDYRIGLSGTPISNGEKNIWSIINLLDDGQRLGETSGEFLLKYFDNVGSNMIPIYKTKKGAAPIIAEIISDIALSLRAEDVNMVLPKVIVNDIELTLNTFDREVYDELEREYVIDFLEGTSTTVKTKADLQNKLLQIASGAIYEDRIEGEPRVWHELNTLKIEALGELIREYPNENWLVVYQYRHELERIRALFPQAVILPKGKALKETFDNWNKGKIKMLVIHPKSAGHGLNLQFGGGFMVWTSPTYNLDHWKQTIARLRRRFGRDFIRVFRLLVKGTHDMRVKRVVTTKESTQVFFNRTYRLPYFRYRYIE